MKKFYILPPIFFFLFSFLFPTFNLAAAESLLIEHKSYSYNKKLNLHSYSQADVKLRDFTISADRLEYKPSDKILAFSGDIFIRSPKTLVMAEKALINLKDATADIYKATLFDQSNRVVIKAEKIRQINPEKFIIEQGSLSACPPDSPAWEIQSEQVIYRLDNFAYSVNTALFFYELPIFYTPFFSWPTSGQRSAGLLAPKYLYSNTSDNSKRYGHRLQVPYFLPFGPDHDLTLTADIIEQRGVGLGLDYQYAFVPGMVGKVKSWILKEDRNARIAEIENLGSLSPNVPNLNPYPSRHTFSFDHRQDIPFNGRFFLHHEQNSDNEVNLEYFSSATIYDYKFLTTAAMTFPWENGGFFINYEEGARFTSQSIFDHEDNRKDYPARLPSLNFFHRFNRVDGLPLSLELSGELTNYQKYENWAGLLAKGGVDITYPFSLGFLNILPQYKKDFYGYSIDYSGGRDYPEQFGMNIEQKKVELNFEFFRLFYNQNKQADRKLSFRPAVIFEEIEDVDQSLAYNPDNLSAPNFILPIFSRRNLTLKWESIYRSRNKDFLKLDLSQIYDFNTNALNHPEDMETEPGDSRLPLRINFSFALTPEFSGNLFYRYDYRKKRIIETRAGLSAFDGMLHLSYVDNRKTYRESDDSYHPKAQFFDFFQQARVTENFDLLLKGSWDRNRQEYQIENGSKVDRQFTNLGFSLIYRHSCYKIVASYSEKIVYRLVDNTINEELRKQAFLQLDIPFVSGNNRVGANLPYKAEYIID